ncbi:hypothetical protein ARMGADRAFT_682521 [Armillaria gallica]|uniref:Uncharacterized protein n=1 Tax=Armillaria gallica TaxID=47427 RepID=A0A2H3CM91_ARMGA|nr:hypothetical protein ARMGADRAFT_682521 [Armillaria gallica]
MLNGQNNFLKSFSQTFAAVSLVRFLIGVANVNWRSSMTKYTQSQLSTGVLAEVSVVLGNGSEERTAQCCEEPKVSCHIPLNLLRDSSPRLITSSAQAVELTRKLIPHLCLRSPALNTPCMMRFASQFGLLTASI